MVEQKKLLFEDEVNKIREIFTRHLVDSSPDAIVPGLNEELNDFLTHFAEDIMNYMKDNCKVVE